MNRLTAITLSLIFVLLSFTPLPAQAQDKPLNEKQKIESLINHLEVLKGVKFIRNGKDYDAKTAARFLRSKWSANESEIKTAHDFIEKAANISSTSGKPYLIRLKDGKEVKCSDYLIEQLKSLENTSS